MASSSSSRMQASFTSVLLLTLLLVTPAAASYVMFDLHGNVYPEGYIYVSMKIGEPAREYFLDVDTGSVLTWVQCHVPNCKGNCKTWKQPHPLYELSKPVLSADDPLCKDLHVPKRDPREKCMYTVKYIQGLTTGFLTRDTVTLPVAQNPHLKIAFGCGYNQPVEKEEPVDGVLGLGRASAVDLISQLKKNNVITKDIVGHCISSHGTGFLFIGDYNPTSGTATWVNMKKQGEHYSPADPANLHFNGKLIGKLKAVVFDSGSTYSYFDKNSYSMIRSEVEGSLDRTLRKVNDAALNLCWKGTQEFRSWNQVKPLFKSMSLVFGQGTHKTTFDIPPENYLIITKQGNVCFGILDASHNAGMEQINIIGAITMQDRLVIYDNVGGKIGWASHSCKKSVSSRL